MEDFRFAAITHFREVWKNDKPNRPHWEEVVNDITAASTKMEMVAIIMEADHDSAGELIERFSKFKMDVNQEVVMKMLKDPKVQENIAKMRSEIKELGDFLDAQPRWVIKMLQAWAWLTGPIGR